MRLFLAFLALSLVGAAPARAQEINGPIEFVKNSPVDFGAIGAKKVGSYLYLTGTHTWAIFDVSDPENPRELSRQVLGYQWENEDVSANGKLLLNSETGLVGGIDATSVLHVWDVSDPTKPA